MPALPGVRPSLLVIVVEDQCRGVCPAGPWTGVHGPGGEVGSKGKAKEAPAAISPALPGLTTREGADLMAVGIAMRHRSAGADSVLVRVFVNGDHRVPVVTVNVERSAGGVRGSEVTKYRPPR